MLGHVLSKEQSKDSSNGVSDDGRLTIVQYHHYHRPPLSDLYRSSIRILPLLQYHQQTFILIIAITNQHHVLSTAAQPEPVKLGIRTEMSGPKSCEALASTCRLRRSLDGCLKFWRSGRSRRVQSRAEKKLKKDESKLGRSRLLS